MLAVTPLVADEKPLGATLDAQGRITALGVESPALVTAGRVPRCRSACGASSRRPVSAGCASTWPGSLESGEPMYGDVIETVVDVDRAEDVALAEALAARPS